MNGGRQRATDERVFFRALRQSATTPRGGRRRAVVPVALALPWIRRQLHQPAAGGIETRPIDGIADHVERTERTEHLGLFVLAASQRADGETAASRVPLNLLNGRNEKRMRAHLDEGRVAVFEQPLNRIEEKNWLSQIAHPVRRIEARSRFAIDGRADHCRIERQRRRLRLETVERVEQIRTERVHLRAVGSDVDFDAAAENFFAFERRDDLVERRGVARQYGGPRAVADRNRQPIAVRGKRRACLVEGELHDRHRTLAARPPQ